MNKNVIIVIALAILVIISGLQALQLNSLKAKLASGETSFNTNFVSQPVTSQQTQSSPSNLDGLPSMVGGC